MIVEEEVVEEEAVVVVEGGGAWRRRWCWGGADRHLSPQDGRADVVANDAGDRVTPAVVAFTESEEVRGR